MAQSYLKGWSFQYAGQGGDSDRFIDLCEGETVTHSVHGIWARSPLDSKFKFEFLLHDIQDGIWAFRYFPAIQHPVAKIGLITADGIPYLAPEIALLYKAARLRDIDEQDFQRVLPMLSDLQRKQLTNDLTLFRKDHPWINLLKINPFHAEPDDATNPLPALH